MNTIFALLASLSMIFSGSAAAIDGQSAQAPVQPAQSGQQVSYSVVTSPYPAAAEQAVSTIRKQGGHRVESDATNTYVAIGLGQRPTGGYSLTVEKVTRNQSGELQITVKENKPQPGMMTTQVITYPTVVISLPKTTQPIKVVYM